MYLGPIGYKSSRGKTWTRLTDELTIKLTLFASRWDANQYFLDVAVTFCDLPPTSGIFSRVDYWIPSGDDMEETLDGESPEHVARFEQILRDELVPLVERIDMEFLRGASADDIVSVSMVSEGVFHRLGR
jgi:hypothetical protein